MEINSKGNLLNIKFHFVAKRYHKAVGVECFRCFLNQAQKLSIEERQASEPFVEIAMAVTYTWNASTINGTDIIRSFPAIGQELRYSLYVNLGPVLDIIDYPSESVATYLRCSQRDVLFYRQLLDVLVEDKTFTHR